MQTLDTNKLKVKYLLLLGIIFFIVLLTRVYYDVKHHEQMINTKMSQLHRSVLVQYEEITLNLENEYLFISNQLMNMHGIPKLMRDRDRVNLYSSMQKQYRRLIQNNPYLYVLHFYDTKNTTILRMHKPQSYDDNLTDIRPIVAKVNRDKKAYFGFETGKNGMTYRITVPFITENGEHLGILEFGIKPQYFEKKIDSLLDVHSEILIKTSSMQNLSYKTNFEKLRDFSIISRDSIFDTIKHKVNLDKQEQTIKDGYKTYIIFNDLNLKTFHNKIVGKVIIAKDITKETRENRDSLVILNTINIVILFVSFILTYIMFTRYSKSLKEAYENVHKLKKAVDTDGLTGINSRISLNNYIQKRVIQINEYAIIFFDIDDFKNINDSYGHDVGDIILKQLTHLVDNTIRVDDFFARWGGEEFVIILKIETIEKAIKITQNIREKINSYSFYNDLLVTCSFGVTMVDTPKEFDLVIKRADKLLYEAKGSGKDCIKSDT